MNVNMMILVSFDLGGVVHVSVDMQGFLVLGIVIGGGGGGGGVKKRETRSGKHFYSP